MPSRLFSPAPQQIWIEKASGRGEDGPVLIRELPALDLLALGVFDGLGGSGGRIVRTPRGEEMSAARYAAELASTVTHHLLDDLGFTPTSGARAQTPARWRSVGDFQRQLEFRLRENFAEQAERIEKQSPSVRGTLSRRLPTTVCVLFAQPGGKPGTTQLNAVWAGDSRAYVWTASLGLAQLTRDHTRGDADALQAIREDAPMNNFVSPDLPFHLSSSDGVIVQEPSIFFCSTDGGFHYFPSPMEHEYALAKALSANMPWPDAVWAFGETIRAVTKDDAALAICGSHWPERRYADAFRRVLDSRLEKPVAALHALQQKLEGATDDERPMLQAHLEQARQDMWRHYKANFELVAPTYAGKPGGDAEQSA